jgi:hypothetical protein
MPMNTNNLWLATYTKDMGPWRSEVASFILEADGLPNAVAKAVLAKPNVVARHLAHDLEPFIDGIDDVAVSVTSADVWLQNQVNHGLEAMNWKP